MPQKIVLSAPAISLGGIVREDLPLQFVHYPGHYGTFFAFSDGRSHPPFLCECSKPAIRNYMELQAQLDTASRNAWSAALKHFPDAVVDRHGDNPLARLRFGEGICHRCNLVPPTMRYCHEMYGVRFIQRFGWYVNQTYLRFGILPRSTSYLPDVTPDELVEDIMRIRQAMAQLREAQEWFHRSEERTRLRILDPSRAWEEDEVDYEEIGRRQAILGRANREARCTERMLSKKIENIVREEFGYRKVGERWTSETLLFQIVCKLFPNHRVLRHHRPDWLQGLELDIFLPDLQLAIEYQGQQHYHPIDAWGGEQALLGLQRRDVRKARICERRGITLISVKYTEPLTQEHIRNRVDERLRG